VHSFHFLPADSRPSWNSLAFSLFREDRLQPSRWPVDFKTIRHLPRPAAQGDLTEFSLGRRLHEDLWHLGFEPHQHLEEFTQSSSQPQLQA
jgi:hypothetical protein